MNPAGSSTSETITSLNSARAIALNDPNYYSQILPAIIPITGPQAAIELQRWGAEFIAETFASPILGAEQKRELSLQVLDRLKELLDSPGVDTNVLKGAVQAAASIYPHVLRHTIKNPSDEATWQKIAAIKSNILRRMDNAMPGVRICCIKFVQRVVQTQTPGVIKDPRRPDLNEISLALVPRDHPILIPSNLEAEASGLLDRLLGTLQEDISDPLLVTATLNSLGSLIRSRASIANKIITQVLNFHPVKLVSGPVTSRSKLVVKSVEKTTRALLVNSMKKSPENPMNPRIQQYIERMQRARIEYFESTRKRSAPVEPTNGVDQTKRQKLAPENTKPPEITPIPTTMTYAQLFGITKDPIIKSFDVTAIPQDTVARITVPLLQAVDETMLQNALNLVRTKYLELGKSRQQAMAAQAAKQQAMAEDDDEYEPDFQPPEDAEQLANRLDTTEERGIDQAPISLGTFKLPPPEPFSELQLAETCKATAKRLFGVMSSTSPSTRQTAPKAGFNRLAASSYDRNSWVTIIVRLATRASAGISAAPNAVKSEEKKPSSVTPEAISNSIRDDLWHYVVEDFRRRIDVAIAWLTEEWYGDFMINKHEGRVVSRNYRAWTMKLLNGILPYLDAKDKNVLIRFMGEIPGLEKDVIDAVKDLARDPERVDMVVTSLLYCIITRPPVRDLCIDAIEDLYRNYEGAKARAAKVLQKWRPHVLVQEEQAGGLANGTSAQAAAPVVVKTETAV
ncbi:hypothetical protein EJ05DRAFT_479766 [Pseudovirgaria hyperparasitica]|uniref:Symplekin/Pta1 N-terminal domain-containing protein n=1 Tax=Pseudovirgaria hyperparasitica TaxID=470096 RepID=A0A6A6VX80_9PEZI|nr:uncharacterized protein EJ05DRAFT_479766 [Pseudovirgaria hyperparasitica]KAF2754240.1 hypothetical protein EJ05DRAFT_479766 [Pseudovirgaria hyperparasitica]